MSFNCEQVRVGGNLTQSEPLQAGYRYDLDNAHKSGLRPACAPERMALFDHLQSTEMPARYSDNIWVGLFIGAALGVIIGLACGHKIGIAHARVVIAEMAADKATGMTP